MIAATMVVVMIMLGEFAGALAGVLTALADAVFVVGWQVATGYQSKI